MDTPTIGIIISTTRPGRFADHPVLWIRDILSSRADLRFEIVDLRDYPLPFYGDAEADAAALGAADRWRAKMEALDGYLFVTAEYNHSISGVLKNALDHGNVEYHRKPATFVGYGGVGGARAIQQLRQICIELEIAPLRRAVHIAMEPMRAVRQEGRDLAEFEYLNDRAALMLDELAWWTRTLKAGRK